MVREFMASGQSPVEIAGVRAIRRPTLQASVNSLRGDKVEEATTD